MPVVLPALRLGLLELLAIGVGDLFGAAERLAGEVDTELFQVAAVGARAIERIDDHPFRIVAVPLAVSFNLGRQVQAFMKGLPPQVVDMGQTLAG